MLEIIKNELIPGDKIKLFLVTGKEPEGVICEISDSSLLLENETKSKIRIFLNMIGGWEIIKKTTSTNNVAANLESCIIQELSIEQKADATVIKSKYTDRPIGLKVLGTIDLGAEKKQVNKEETIAIEPLPDISGSFSSFKDLKRAADKLVIDKIVSPNGYIVKHSSQRGFGFLHDSEDNEIYFNYNDILDSELLEKLEGTRQHQHIQISFTLISSGERKKAYSLHLPWTVIKTLEKAGELQSEKDYVNARNLCVQILEIFPGNSDAEDLIQKIENQNKSLSFQNRGTSQDYFRAKKAKEAKNYDEAVKYFLKALGVMERIESTVKDLATTYQEMGEIEKGVELLGKYLEQLPKNSATYNFAANYYTAAGLVERALEYLDLLESISPKYKMPDLYYRKSVCYIKAERFPEALECIKQILKTDKSNPIALKLEEKLFLAIETGVYEKADLLIDGTEFAKFTGGLPQILIAALENSDFAGLPATVKSRDKISINHLKQIRNLIEEAGKARPRERTRYLLTEAKLVQLLHPENEEELRKTLSRYCTAMAISYEVENYNAEISRYYHLLSFELEPNWNTNARQVSMYLMSFTPSLKNSPKLLGLDSLISELDFKGNIWDGLIDLLISNSEISSVIVGKLYNDSKKRKETVAFAETYLNKEFIVNSQTDFVTVWNKIREFRISEYRKLLGVVRSIIDLNQIESFAQQFKQYEAFLKYPWLPKIDKIRIDDLFDSLYYSILTYLAQVGFDDKEKFKSLIIGQITQLMDEINDQPTRFSYEGLLPLLRHIEILVNQSFKKIIESSTPIVTLSILGESRFLDEDNNVAIQIGISNSKGCSPIHDIELKILDNTDYRIKDSVEISSQSLKGGEQRIIAVHLIVNDSALKQEATILNITGSYKTRNAEEPFIIEVQQLSLRFYSYDNFETINNPFAAVADSGPVKDRSMFFGRDLLIEEICNSLMSLQANKCIIIRGQKRSGKSSLLHHLKETLTTTGKFICIHFSLGLTEEISSATFYWQILNGIAEFLQDNCAPEKKFFSSPILSDLRENPSIVFYEQITKLQQEINSQEEWKSKKLLLMIDEFTYIYSAILRGKMSPEFMKTWKSLLEKGFFSAILVGQDVMPKFKAKFPNEFGVTEDRRLTYLDPQDAEQLITKPIWDSINNRSRFIGKAIDRILDYTSSNPYYIQIFCSRLVDFMNDSKHIVVTEADINEVAKSFTDGPQTMAIDKFDNLINAGDADLEAVSQEDTIEILRQIANNSRIIGSCSRDSIKLREDEKYVDQILNDLVSRDVLMCPQRDYYRIQVQIFNNWLLKH